MKKSLPSIVTGIALLAILILYMVTYQVRFTEVAIVKTFGRASESDVIDGAKAAGLYWKWPWPIQDVDIYDARTRTLETHTEQTATHDKKTVIITSYVGWRIADPYKFRTQLGGDRAAESLLRTNMETLQKEVVGQYAFSQLVSKRKEELRFDQIEGEIAKRLAQIAGSYGIAIDAVGIKRLELPQDVTQSVFETMKQERRAKAQQYESEGEAIKSKIIADAESRKNTILAFAQARAQRYLSEGNSRAAEYYRVLQEDEELALFLDRLKKLKEILKDRTTIVLNWNQYPFIEFRQQGQLASPPVATRPAGQAAARGGVIHVLPGGSDTALGDGAGPE